MQPKTLSTAVKAVLAVFALTLLAANATAQEKVLYSFYNSGGVVLPVAGVISDAAGNLYGTTFYGGAYGDGMVFELSPDATGWKMTVLHSFGNGTDGFWVTGGLVFDTHGNLFGTTEFGGTGGCTTGIGGCGTIFELSPNGDGTWTETALYNFQGSDGFEAHAGLIVDAAGNLYGDTANGGAYSQGVVFELSPAAGGTWTESTLYNFTGGTDGGVPYGNLLLGPKGNLYGMTSAGGTTTTVCRYGCGTVFELRPTASGNWTEKVVHTFGQSSGDGRFPSAGLIFDAKGNLYGSVGEGGGSGRYNRGVVFELSPVAGGSGQWSETILYNFNDVLGDGNNPAGNLLFDSAGNLYGVTLIGGTSGGGTAFELSPTTTGSWTETILHDFSNQGTDGYNPNAGLIFSTSGSIFGTTGEGGSRAQGTAFEIKR